MADGSLRAVESVKLGEMVLCADGSAHRVSELYAYDDAPLLKISTRAGGITVTPNHEMFCDRGKILAEDLVLGDSLELASTSMDRFDEIVSIEYADYGKVHCVTVEEKHELIAEGFRVGNSFDQGRAKFQGTSRDLVWLDENPPVEVYTECLTRLLTRHGLLICTFTPIEGINDVVLMFLPHMAPEPSTQDLEADVV
jgi:phage terminase large subunit-like protein